MVVVDLPGDDRGQPEAFEALNGLARQAVDRVASRVTPESGRTLVLMAPAAGDSPVIRREVQSDLDAAYAEIVDSVTADDRTHVATVMARARKDAGPTGALVYVGTGALPLPSAPAGKRDVFSEAHREALEGVESELGEALADDARVVLPSAFVPRAWRTHCDAQPSYCVSGRDAITADAWLDDWLPVVQPPEPAPAVVPDPQDQGPPAVSPDAGAGPTGGGPPDEGGRDALLIVLSTLAGVGLLVTLILLMRARGRTAGAALEGLLLVEEISGPVDDPIRHEALVLQPGQREYRVESIPCSTGDVVGFALRAVGDGAVQVSVLYEAEPGRTRPEPIDEPLRMGGAVRHSDLRLRLVPMERDP